jgi:hypothetical protein
LETLILTRSGIEIIDNNSALRIPSPELERVDIELANISQIWPGALSGKTNIWK